MDRVIRRLASVLAVFAVIGFLAFGTGVSRVRCTPIRPPPPSTTRLLRLRKCQQRGTGRLLSSDRSAKDLRRDWAALPAEKTSPLPQKA